MTDPHYTDEAVTLYHGDCIEVLRELPDASVDAVVTDPPYGLEFMGREWDAPWKSAGSHAEARTRRAEEMTDERKRRFIASGVNSYEAGVGFQAWCTDWAAECLRVLKPGGHLVAFGGSRTWHRLAAAVEDAGYEIRDSIAWLYGTGFPKSRDVTDAMNRWLAGDRSPETLARAIPPIVYDITAYLRAARNQAGWTNPRIDALFGTNGMAGHWTSSATQPAVPSVRQWQVLKEKLGFGDEMDELVAQFAATERELAAAAGRPVGPFLGTLTKGEPYAPHGGWGTALKPSFEPIVVGRKRVAGSTTANVQQHGTGALNIDGCRVPMSAEDRARFERGSAAWAEMSERRGETRADGTTRKSTSIYGEYGNEPSRPNDAGRWPPNVVLDDTIAADLDKQSSEGGGSRFFPVFRYEAKAPTFERPRAGEIAHPTVKPYDLMRWLVRLVTPPGGTVLEPFAGSGTTAEACVAEGMRCIAIEREAEYLPLIVQRLRRPIQLGFSFGEL